MYHPSDSLGCVRLVGGALVFHRPSSKRKGRSLIEQPLLLSFSPDKANENHQMIGIHKGNHVSRHSPCEMPSTYRCLHSWLSRHRHLQWHFQWARCWEDCPVQILPSFISLQFTSVVAFTVCNTPPPHTHTNTHKLFFFIHRVSWCNPSCSWAREALCLSLPNCWIIGIHRSAQFVKCVLVHARFHLEMLS